MKNKTPIVISELSLELLRKHPIWTWHEGSLQESEDKIVPVDLVEQAIDSYSSLFISANFSTACGRTLAGSVNYDIVLQEVFGIELLIESEAFGFNVGLPEMFKDDLGRLRNALGDEAAIIFPMVFESAVEIEPSRRLKGVFRSPTD